MPRAEAGPDHDVHVEARQIIQDMRSSVSNDGDHWFYALTAAIRSWPLPVEVVDGRTYRYLVGGEAFDWLLLCERLLDEMPDLVPEEEAEALLFHERLPVDATEEDFEKLLGAKYKAHLNFVYGVRVEAALQVAVGEEVRKERTASLTGERRIDDDIFGNIYGKTRDELLSDFREERGVDDPEWLSLAELSEWRYWLFQYRVKNCDPAKVASDTRKGLTLLQNIEHARRRAAPDEI